MQARFILLQTHFFPYHSLHTKMRERAVMGEPQIFIFSGDAWLHQENKGGRGGFCGLNRVDDLARPNVSLKDLCPAKISSSWKSAKVMMRLKSTTLVLLIGLALAQARQRGSGRVSKEKSEESDREGKCKLNF